MTLILYGLPLAVTFATLSDPGSAWNWALGAALGLLLAAGATYGRGAPPTRMSLRQIAMLPLLLFGLARGIAIGGWLMLLVTLGRRNWRNVGFVTIENAAETERGLAVLALTQSAMPGSVVADIDRDERRLVINLLDGTEAEAERAEVAHFYRRYQRPSLP